jgi:Domain of unknown function (DUF4286)
MIIYEITAIVQAELIALYEKYMQDVHIPDLMATGHFSGAVFSRSTSGRYRIQYQAHNQNALTEYLKNEAPRLREEFHSHFPTGVTLTRENWEVLQTYKI